MNSLAVLFEKPKKLPKIADFAYLEPLWSLITNFSGHPVCGKMLGIQSSFTCRSTRGGCLVNPERDPRFYKFSSLRAHPATIHFLAKENQWYLLIFLSKKMFVIIKYDNRNKSLLLKKLDIEFINQMVISIYNLQKLRELNVR